MSWVISVVLAAKIVLIIVMVRGLPGLKRQVEAAEREVERQRAQLQKDGET